MLEIKTQFGNFGNFKDLLIFMKTENHNQVHVDTYYIFDKINSLELTIEDVEIIIKGEV